MSKTTHSFQAEIKEILDLMIHSLYSHKEIFLRELISNASDAIDKLKYEGLTQPELLSEGTDYYVRLSPNSESRELSIVDNGIGMSYDEVVENIGTIARSGTKKWLEIKKELKDNPELIGQFGVGFYSAFMVADKVTVWTQKAGSAEGTLWESKGDGTFSVEKKPRTEGRGTTITLHLKPELEKEESFDVLSEWSLRNLVKKYSDFIAYPIKLLVKRDEPLLDSEGKPIEGKTSQVEKDEILNSQKALWLRNSNEIKTEEYDDFYKHLTHDWSEPLKTVHFKAEGTLEFQSLLFIPSKRPFNYNYKDYKAGLALYVKRVFIMNDCEQLLPEYFRFIRGVVDSSELSLNVSREMLQQNRQVEQIRKSLTTKVLNTLKDLLEKDRPTFEKFWSQFGDALKEGVVTDYANREKLEGLLLFHSTFSDQLTTLKDYKERMKTGQKAIYFITSESLAQAQNSPHLEKLKARGYEVLLLCQPIDEWMVDSFREYQGTPIQSITKEDLDLETEDEKKATEEEFKQYAEKYQTLLTQMKDALKDQVKDVRFTSRLTESPACLVSGNMDPSARMERIMENMGMGEKSRAKRILELNPNHPLVERMNTASNDVQKEWADILFNQSLLAEGSPLPNPSAFAQKIGKLLMNANPNSH